LSINPIHVTLERTSWRPLGLDYKPSQFKEPFILQFLTASCMHGWDLGRVEIETVREELSSMNATTEKHG